MSAFPMWVWLCLIVFGVMVVMEAIRKDRVRRAEHILAKEIIADDNARKSRGKIV
jgi:hypothetical protein